MGSRNATGARLPSGDELTELVWRNLVHRLPSDVQVPVPAWPSTPEEVTDYRDLFGLRLELLMEIVFRAAADDDCLDQAGRWFAWLCEHQFRGALPCEAHAALVAMCSGAQLTLNFDKLLEDAGARKVIHLHGAVDDPSSLVATISQYQQGLPASIQGVMREALEGKSVLVAGYSGRDRDVLPLLTLLEPASITWLQHPGGAISLEAAELQKSGIIRVIEATIPDYAATIGVTYRTQFAGIRHRDVTREPVQLPIGFVADVVLEVLSQQGRHDIAAAFAISCRLAGIKTTSRFQRLLGRMESSTGRHSAAIRYFLRPGALLTNANELTAAVGRKYGWRWPNILMARAAECTPEPKRKQTAFSAWQRVAHQENLRGNVGKGLELDQRHSWLSEGVVSPQVKVNALLFHADRLRTAGFLLESERCVRAALLDAPYCAVHTRAYLLLMEAHRRLCIGDVGGSFKALNHADALLGRESNPSINYPRGAWLDLVRANAIMTSGSMDGDAQGLIERAISFDRYEAPLAGALARLYAVEFHAAQGESVDVGRANNELRRFIRSINLHAPHLIKSAELIAFEVSIHPDTHGREQWLRQLSDWFGKRGHGLARARVLGTMNRTFGKGFTSSHLAAWRAEGMHDAIKWAMSPATSPRMHWILPF